MTEYRKGDVCSLEVTVTEAPDSAAWIRVFSGGYGDFLVSRSNPTLKLIRRAHVDLATCELPVEVADDDGDKGTLIHRDGEWAWLKYPAPHAEGECSHTIVHLSEVRPLDAPAPESEVERLLARVERLAVALRRADDDLAQMDAPRGPGTTRGAIAAALAATAPTSETSRPMTGMFTHLSPEKQGAALAYRGPENHGTLCQPKPDVTYTAHNAAPTCPPGHIMIGDRAVPEPMRSEPKDGDQYWYPGVGSLRLAFENFWDGDGFDQHRLRSGLIHSTEANARAHAEAIIALSAGEGV